MFRIPSLDARCDPRRPPWGPLLVLSLLSVACGADAGSSEAEAGASSEPDEEIPASKNGPDGCPVDSGFPGDDSCLPPSADPGALRLHYGPGDYDDPDDVARFVIEPGVETNHCLFLTLPNESDFYYRRAEGSMRPGSHHLVARALSKEERMEEDGFADCRGVDMGVGNADDIGVPGAQSGTFSYPPDAPDFEGLARVIPAGRQGMLNAHYINSTDGPILTEAWVNYEPAEPENVRDVMAPIALAGGLAMRIAPRTNEILSYACRPDRAIRVYNLFAHYHAHGVRFSAWKEAADGSRTLLLESFDWEHLGSFSFDTATVNSPPDGDRGVDGAISGPLTVGPDEALAWECEIHNTSDATLKFRNEVYTGEMCILFGAQTAVEGESVPFTCIRN
jgi:hypothetical protein